MYRKNKPKNTNYKNNAIKALRTEMQSGRKI